MASDVYGVIIERPGQDPILLEMEGEHADMDSAMRRGRGMANGGRYCVVRLEYHAGNRLLLMDMERLSAAAQDDMEIPL